MAAPMSQNQAETVCQQIVDISNILDRSTVVAQYRATSCSVPARRQTISSVRHQAEFSRPPSCRSTLPVEILDLIFRLLDNHELFQVTLSNKSLHDIATGILYRTIQITRLVESVRCLQTLARTPQLARLVRSLDISWATTITNPLRNLYQLAHKALRSLPLLTSLALDIDKSCVWILSNFPSQLRAFSASFYCDTSLAHFLDSQPRITELTLRGPSSGHSQFTLQAGNLTLVPVKIPFSLLPSSLPELSHLRAIHAGPEILRAIIKDRPVVQVSMPLYSENAYASLNALQTSSEGIKRLNIMSFDPEAPEYLLSEVAKRFPQLEALHIVILLAYCSEVRCLHPSPTLSFILIAIPLHEGNLRSRRASSGELYRPAGT